MNKKRELRGQRKLHPPEKGKRFNGDDAVFKWSPTKPEEYGNATYRRDPMDTQQNWLCSHCQHSNDFNEEFCQRLDFNMGRLRGGNATRSCRISWRFPVGSPYYAPEPDEPEVRPGGGVDIVPEDADGAAPGMFDSFVGAASAVWNSFSGGGS